MNADKAFVFSAIKRRLNENYLSIPLYQTPLLLGGCETWLRRVEEDMVQALPLFAETRDSMWEPCGMVNTWAGGSTLVILRTRPIPSNFISI